MSSVVGLVVAGNAAAAGRDVHCTEMCSDSEAGSYLRLIDPRITQLEAQGPSRTCHESKEEEEGMPHVVVDSLANAIAGSYLRLIDCCITRCIR